MKYVGAPDYKLLDGLLWKCNPYKCVAAAATVDSRRRQQQAGTEGEQEEEEEQWCPVCLSTLHHPRRLYNKRLSCGHTFHPSCINRWLTTRSLCPVCRGSCYTTSQHGLHDRRLLGEINQQHRQHVYALTSPRPGAYNIYTEWCR